MTTHPFEHDDAAYVMGALDPTQATAFEYHLADCRACRARVAEARSTVALLAPVRDAGLPATAGGAAGDVPQTLLPGLLRRAAQQRSRRRWFTAAVSGAAAACLIALAVVAWPASGPSAPGQTGRQALRALQPSPVQASAVVVAKTWGTEIDLRCRYERGITAHRPYRLRVVDRDRHVHDAGSWQLVPGKEISFVGGTEVRRDRIAKIQVTLPNGTPILQLSM